MKWGACAAGSSNLGVAFVEFALGAMLLLLVIAMSLEGGWYFYQRAAAGNALSVAERSAVFSQDDDQCRANSLSRLAEELGKNGFNAPYEAAVDFCWYSKIDPPLRLMRIRLTAQPHCFFCQILPGGERLASLKMESLTVVPGENCLPPVPEEEEVCVD